MAFVLAYLVVGVTLALMIQFALAMRGLDVTDFARSEGVDAPSVVIWGVIVGFWPLAMAYAWKDGR